MAEITLKNNPIHTNGELPLVGSIATNFKLIGNDLQLKSLVDFTGKNVVLNIFPSVDTSTCATSVRQFNQKAGDLENTVVLCISRDLPFAQSRFCGAEGIENVHMLSEYQNDKFSEAYGLKIIDGPLTGLHSRCVVVIDTQGKVIYTEQVPEIIDEPNYDKALAAIS